MVEVVGEVVPACEVPEDTAVCGFPILKLGEVKKNWNIFESVRGYEATSMYPVHNRAAKRQERFTDGVRGVLGNKCAGQHNLKTLHFKETIVSANF